MPGPALQVQQRDIPAEGGEKSLALSITAAPNLFTLKQWNAAGLKIGLEQKEKGEKEEERSGILEF